jgi:phosphohistidine swiveling domain-containing protein
VTVTVSEAGFPGPDEIEGFWAFDKMHAPRPVTPLASDLIVMTLADGFTEAQAEFDALVAVTNRMVNYYYYASFHPLADPDELEDRKSRYEQTLDVKVPVVGKQWTEEWKPEIIALNRQERKVDYTALSDDELLAKLDELEERMRDYWRVHGRINFVLIASSKYCDFYDEVMAPEDPTESYQSIQGYETESLAASRGLWNLSRTVRANADLRQLFETTAPAERLAELEKTDDGRAFLADLHAYLDDYGWRSDAVYDIADITWREDPTIPLGALNSYIGLEDKASPDALYEKAVATRERLLAGVRGKLADDPEKLAHFEELYEAAKYSNPLTEDHAFWIDQMGVTIVRRFTEEVGRRLAERNQLERPDDVHMLYKDELVATVEDKLDQRALGRQRREEMEAWAKITPPPTLGTPPPPEADPFMDAITVRLLGITPPDDTPPEPDVFKGVAGSPGVVRGTARVVRSLAEAAVLQDGDIMVCEMTLPPWVPLFSIVSGVVTDTGGVLSHCAIVAREFELPAVVGTQVGTSSIPDGALVEVDGTKGVVTIIEYP